VRSSHDLTISRSHDLNDLVSKDSLASFKDEVWYETIDDQQKWRNSGGMVDTCIKVSSEHPRRLRLHLLAPFQGVHAEKPC
jgi:hypothetical protein